METEPSCGRRRNPAPSHRNPGARGEASNPLLRPRRCALCAGFLREPPGAVGGAHRAAVLREHPAERRLAEEGQRGHPSVLRAEEGAAPRHGLKPHRLRGGGGEGRKEEPLPRGRSIRQEFGVFLSQADGDWTECSEVVPAHTPELKLDEN